MSVTGPNTGFKIVNVDGGPNTQDLGERYVSKDYLLDVYPNLIPGRTTPGLWTWGDGGNGRLGDGTIVSKSSPVQVGSLTNWKQVSAAQVHTMAVKTDGTLWGWGNNANGVGGGAIGDNTTIAKSSPVQVGTLTNWKQVSASTEHTMAVKTDGTLWAWGRNNNNGKLGDGTQTNRSSPVQVGLLTNWKQVSAGVEHTVAVKTDGTIWGWGENVYGQVGDGTVINKSSPVQVGTLTNWKYVAAVRNCTVALKTDGTIWAWGRNNFGQLGDGTVINKSSPVQVGSLTNWKSITAETLDNTVLAIKTDGTLWAWGSNGSGQMGDGTIVSKSSPVQIGSLTNWKQVESSGGTSFAIKTDGTLWAWGSNESGCLGDSTTSPKSSPIQIGSLTNWKQISGGNIHTAAILDGYI